MKKASHFIKQKYIYHAEWEDLKKRATLELTSKYPIPHFGILDEQGGENNRFNSGWRHHEINAKYFVSEMVSTYPAITDSINGNSSIEIPTYDFESNPNGLMQGITYIQALAFYDWKYQSRNI